MDLSAKKMISTVLLICFLSTIFHLHPHTHSHTNFSVQIINQQNEANHHYFNECEKCLTKNNSIGLQYPDDNFLNNFFIQPKYKSKNSTRFILHLNIYSRPPPFNYL